MEGQTIEAPQTQQPQQSAPLSFKQEMMQEAAKKFGGDTSANPAPPAANPASSTPVIGQENNNQPAAPAPAATEPPANTPPPATEPPVAAQPPAAQPAAPNYDAILAEISGGAFANMDAFKAALPTFQQYPVINQRVTELEAEIAKNPFANDYVKGLNELVKSGANSDQIEAYQVINKLDLPTMNPRDVKINKMVLIDGYPRSVAELKVDKEFNLSDESLLPAEKQILEADLAVSAKQDLAALAKYKAEVSTAPQNTQAESALQHQAKVQDFTSKLETAIPQLVPQFVGLGTKNISVKEGNVAFDLPVEINYPDAFKAQIPGMIKEYFLDGLTPITTDNIQAAQNYVKAQYLLTHEDELVNNIAARVGKQMKETVDAQYENRSGIVPPVDNPNNVVTGDQQFKSFQEKIANRGGRQA